MKWVCQVCGYVHEGDEPPEACPQCKAPASKFTKQEGEMTWAAEHVVGVAKGVSEDIIEDLRSNTKKRSMLQSLPNFSEKLLPTLPREILNSE